MFQQIQLNPEGMVSNEGSADLDPVDPTQIRRPQRG